MRRAIVMTIGVILALIVALPVAFGQTGPTMLVDGLKVRTAASGLVTPVSVAFIDNNDMLVLEKNTGKVRRVTNGVVQSSAVLDLAVNFGSERGLLGIALIVSASLWVSSEKGGTWPRNASSKTTSSWTSKPEYAKA